MEKRNKGESFFSPKRWYICVKARHSPLFVCRVSLLPVDPGVGWVGDAAGNAVQVNSLQLNSLDGLRAFDPFWWNLNLSQKTEKINPSIISLLRAPHA